MRKTVLVMLFVMHAAFAEEESKTRTFKVT